MTDLPERQPIRMDLRENAYDFLNESLRAAQDADSRPHAWKFAILHVVQAIELLLKARLQAEHPALIYENIDRRGNTVSFQLAVERIISLARIELSPRERRALRRAQTLRDPIVHFEFEMNEYEVKSIYVQLFEFLMRFHDEHTDFGALHDHIDSAAWSKEAELMEFFRREHIVYRGEEMFKGWPAEIVRAQSQTTSSFMARRSTGCGAVMNRIPKSEERARIRVTTAPYSRANTTSSPATWRLARGASASSSAVAALGAKAQPKENCRRVTNTWPT
jgi:hypothetical protein